MTKLNFQNYLPLTLGCLAGAIFANVSTLQAANSPFASTSKPAVAWSAGTMKINGTDHSGSANVLPGQAVETGRSASQLYLADGSRLRLGASSRLEVKADALNLASGVARVDSVAPGQAVLPIRAGELEIRGRDGVVARPSASDVLVSASANPVEVRRHDGVFIAMVRPGQTLSFAFGKATAKLDELSGTVVKEKGKYFVKVDCGKNKVELLGESASAWEGKQVLAKGHLNQMASDKATFTVKEFAPQDRAANCAAVAAGLPGSANGAGTTATTAAGSTTGATATAGASAAGISTKVVIMGIVVASSAAGASALALINGEETENISQP